MTSRLATGPVELLCELERRMTKSDLSLRTSVQSITCAILLVILQITVSSVIAEHISGFLVPLNTEAHLDYVCGLGIAFAGLGSGSLRTKSTFSIFAPLRPSYRVALKTLLEYS